LRNANLKLKKLKTLIANAPILKHASILIAQAFLGLVISMPSFAETENKTSEKTTEPAIGMAATGAQVPNSSPGIGFGGFAEGFLTKGGLQIFFPHSEKIVLGMGFTLGAKRTAYNFNNDTCRNSSSSFNCYWYGRQENRIFMNYQFLVTGSINRHSLVVLPELGLSNDRVTDYGPNLLNTTQNLPYLALGINFQWSLNKTVKLAVGGRIDRKLGPSTISHEGEDIPTSYSGIFDIVNPYLLISTYF
jgi:hypothetical protein